MSQKQAAMVKGGIILSQVLHALEPQIKSGLTTFELDQQASRLIKKYGGEVSFNKVPGYSWATCLSVNEGVVHGVPNSYRLQEGDLLKLDIGVYYGGYHVDYANSYYLGTPSPEISRFLAAGKKALTQAIKAVHAGVHIGIVSKLIQTTINGSGYRVIYNLTGHTVGKKLHEDPLIPQFLEGNINQTPVFQAETAYAIEVIYAMADTEIVHANNDGWSLRTKNKSQSACFENTVFVNPNNTFKLVN